MTDIVEQAIKAENYQLATDVLERHIAESGPNTKIYIQLGKALAHLGRISESVAAYLKGYRLGKVESNSLSPLVNVLVKITRERMMATNKRKPTDSNPTNSPLSQNDGLILDTRAILEVEPFFCGLCIGTLNNPVTIFCGHTFCNRCVAREAPDSCMVCGPNPNIEGGFRPNIIVSALVDKLFPNISEVTQKKTEAHRLYMDSKLDSAQNLYTAILKLCNNDHTIWSNRSFINCLLKDFKSAHEDALQTIRYRPQWPKGYYRLGSALEGLNRPQEAAMAYMKCLALDESALAAENCLTTFENQYIKQGILEIRAGVQTLLPKLPEWPLTKTNGKLYNGDVMLSSNGIDDLNKILDTMMKPETAPVESKHRSSTEEPVAALMDGNALDDEDIQESLNKFKEILDKQFKDCDTVLKFSSRMDDINTSVITPDQLDCSLCRRLMHEPVTTPCGHSFCRHCLNRALDYSIACPSCRTNLLEYIKVQKKPVTVALDILMKKWWPIEVEERRKAHLEDLATFSTTGNTATIPIFVCTMAYPTLSYPLHVFEPRYRLMMRQVLESGVRQFGMCMPSPDTPDTYVNYGTMLEIADCKFLDDGRIVIDTVGGRRFRVMERGMRDGYNTAKVQFLNETQTHESALGDLQKRHDDLYDEVTVWLSSLPSQTRSRLDHHHGPIPTKDGLITSSRLGPAWVWWLANILPLDNRSKVSFLGMNCLSDRLALLSHIINSLASRQ